MTTSRRLHTATLLQDGRVLVAGGIGGPFDFTLASAELYDPKSGLWTATGSMSTIRRQHTATLLPSGKVLVVGGDTGLGIDVTSAELYDPNTGLWSATGSLLIGRLEHQATLLPTGRVLVTGGANVFGTLLPWFSAELYDPDTGLWSATGSLLTGRAAHQATLLPTGKVLIAGGVAVEGPPAISTELYDPAAGTWTATGNLGTGRVRPSATLLPDGQVLLAGGVTNPGSPTSATAAAELYNASTGLWTATGNMTEERWLHQATLLPSGKVLVTGGVNDTGGDVSSSELYDPRRDTWSTSGMMLVSHARHTATLLSTGLVLVAGDGASAELYRPRGKRRLAPALISGD